MASNIDGEELPEEHDETFLYHDRYYHRISRDSRAYYVPVDEIEKERLRLMNQIFFMKFQTLILPEPKMHAVRRVLDCGTGTADWALAVAQKYPNCEVHAVDISSLMMPWSPPNNLYLGQCDLNETIPYTDKYFDLVQSRLLAGGINATRWNHYMREIKRVLIRGGWVQMIEIYFNAQSGRLPDDGGLRKWSSEYLRAMRQLGKDPSVGMRLGDMLTAAGFVEVEAQSFELPMCGWSRDEAELQLGAYNQQNVSELLHSLALWPLTSRRGLRWSVEDFNQMVDSARAEAGTPSLKPYFQVYVAVGRKK